MDTEAVTWQKAMLISIRGMHVEVYWLAFNAAARFCLSGLEALLKGVYRVL